MSLPVSGTVPPGRFPAVSPAAAFIFYSFAKIGRKKITDAVKQQYFSCQPGRMVFFVGDGR
jgi:hypothetical protein